MNIDEICMILEIKDKAPFFIESDYARERCFITNVMGIHNDYGIHIKFNNVSRLVNEVKCNNFNEYDLIMELIDTKNKSKNISEEVIFCVFCILHEVGHIIHFKDSGLSSKEYMEKYKMEYDIYECKKTQELDGITNGERDKVLKKYDKLYREIEPEKRADMYALSEISKALNKLK